MEGSNDSESTGGAPKKSRLKSLCKGIKVLSPLRYFDKALDFYVKSVSECAGRSNYSGLGMGMGVSNIALPNTFTTSSTNGDKYAASKRSNPPPGAQVKKIPKSFSNSAIEPMDTIDEDIPCYFTGSFRKSAAFLFPSH
ncbi:hypothetical protein SUGI_0558710 [Cryptomeria japonica]|nr:hypothetical protein SUGI_0558710 [Cryptomeria japonica]